MPDLNDESAAIIEKARNGDSNAFELLISPQLDFISREIAKFVPPANLQDVAQEVLLRVFLALPGYQERGTFRWWLKKIVSRACLDFWRHERRQELTARAAGDEQTTETEVDSAQAAANTDLRRFLATLSADDRLVFTLAFLDDRPRREISELLGLSLTAVKVRCFRLRGKAKMWFEI